MSARGQFLSSLGLALGAEASERASSALEWMESLHAGRLRASGEAAWEHDLRVAAILLDMGMDAESIVAGVLHDAFEVSAAERARAAESDQGQPRPVEEREAHRGRGGRNAAQARVEEQAHAAALGAELSTRFGAGVALLVEDVSRLASLKARNKTVQAAETIRKMLFAMARDIRVILIKLADKLDSMRTLRFLPEERQKEIAAECLDVFAPLADRLGVSWLKDELEDLALKSLNREAYEQIKDIVSSKKGERESYLQRVELAIREAAAAEGIGVEVSARAKHFYSIYQKMRKRAKAAEELFDLLGLRLICGGENECYALLGMVHRLWKPIEGRFKDYIAMPKANGYRSLHTTVMCFEGRLLEVQIRSAEMQRVAENGIASHWLYKKGTAAEAPRPEDIPIVNRLREWGDFVSQGAEYLEEIKRELLKDSIFVFTPRGDVVQLPAGATPLDFAYAIHTDVGGRCVGAKADGQIVSLDAELRNTQVVEILTSPNARPNMNWLRIARTSKARSKIRAALVQSGQVLAIDRNIVAGRRAAATPAQRPSGAGREAEESRPEGQGAHRESGPRRAATAAASSVDYRSYEPGEALRNERAGVAIGGARNMMIRIAGCCRPVTGDAIVGYVSRGRGIIVHRADCRSVNAIADFAERRIDVRWEEGAGAATARFRLTARKSANLFSEIESAARKFGGRLREGHLGERGDGTLTGYFTMELESREDLRKVAKAVRGVPAVIALDEDD